LHRALRAAPAILVLLFCLRVQLLSANEPGDSVRPASPPRFHIVGYVPEYRVADLDPQIGQFVTDLIYFSARPEATGDLQMPTGHADDLVKLRKIKQDSGGALLLCVGGWERSAGFVQVAKSDETRRKFAANLVQFCRENHFDGADIDWEHPADDIERDNQGLLLKTIRQAFEPHKLQLTIATAGWQQLTPEAIRSVDRIHLMAYDAEGRHSTLEFAEADLARLEKAGVSASKICLGVPFYGRGIRDRSQVLTYQEIAKRGRLAPDVDELDGMYFNGPRTIERKTKLAISRKLPGVMIWELGQDATGESSLLRVIHRAANPSAKAK
jgi:GH18 family chitinase